MDINTNNAIPVVAPGDLYSAWLGNDIAGSQAEKLSFSFNVTTDRELFVYKYAVVVEDPGQALPINHVSKFVSSIRSINKLDVVFIMW